MTAFEKLLQANFKGYSFQESEDPDIEDDQYTLSPTMHIQIHRGTNFLTLYKQTSETQFAQLAHGSYQTILHYLYRKKYIVPPKSKKKRRS